MNRTSGNRRARKVAVVATVLGLWGALVLLFAAPLALPGSVSWRQAVSFGGSFWALWLLFLPAVAWLSFRFATRVYSDDNQERLPSAEILPTQPIDPQNPLPRICDVLARYVARTAGTNTNSATVFKCPADKMGRFAAQGSSYEWNADLNGHRIDETRTDSAFLLLQRGNLSGGITNFVLTFPPGTTPLFLDYDDFHPRSPKPGKNVVFMDGHAAPLEATGDDSRAGEN